MNKNPEDQKPTNNNLESLLPIDEHIEKGQNAKGHKIHHHNIYLLPNLFTTTNLFADFYSIINAMNNNFYITTTTVFITIILDGLS